MKSNLIIILILIPTFIFSQVGIGTTTPKGQLDVTSSNLGIVVPRVTSIEVVTDGNGNTAVNGTIVYDLSRNQLCTKVNDSWVCMSKDNLGNPQLCVPFTAIQNTYLKPITIDDNDKFGNVVSLSSDGTRLAVGAPTEDSNGTSESDNSSTWSGAVYIFKRDGAIWSQEAYIKTIPNQSSIFFGSALSLNNDGTRLAIGAYNESSNGNGIYNNSLAFSGATFIFKRTGVTWTQEAYLKANVIDSSDKFGISVQINADATRLIIGARNEDSNGTTDTDDSFSNSGAAYIFKRTGTTWSQEAYLKATVTDTSDLFGNTVAINSDGSKVAIGAIGEKSNGNGSSDNSMNSAGAVYIFSRTGTTWVQESYLKSSNPDIFDQFGSSLSFNDSGSILAIGAPGESSNGSGEANNDSTAAGAVYIFENNSNVWLQTSYLKPLVVGRADSFGNSISLSTNGKKLAIGAFQEESNDSDPANNSAIYSGAVYYFYKSGSIWVQEKYIKSDVVGSGDNFGNSVSLNNNGSILAIGAPGEDSNGSNPANNSILGSGAVYVII